MYLMTLFKRFISNRTVEIKHKLDVIRYTGSLNQCHNQRQVTPRAKPGDASLEA